MDAIPMLEVRLLGGFQVLVAGNPVPEALWRQRRSAAIVKLLALEPTHRLHREQLLDTLWPDLEPDAAANNLRVALHHARQGLQAAGAPGGSVLVREGDVIQLAPPYRLSVDVTRFRASVADAWNSSEPAPSLAAIELYTGDLLPGDLYDEWLDSPRTALRTSFLTLLQRLAKIWEVRNEPERAIAVYQRLLQSDPLDESAHRSLIRLLAAIGQQQHALALAGELVALLERDLLAQPEPATQELIAAIREGRFVSAEPSREEAPAREPYRASRRLRALPASVDELIGREREIVEIVHLLERSRLVTLTGPGGVGKTRLALAVAQDVAGVKPTEAVFVELDAIENDAYVLPAIAAAVGVHEEPGQSLRDAVVDRLLTGPMLLVLDNLEHVAASAPQLGDFLASCPELRVLATSRVRLHLKGEQEYQVQPLLVPDEPRSPPGVRNALPQPAASLAPAVTLFLRRAQSTRPDFAIDGANVVLIGEICRQLDGLPLAIELAAARVRVLSLADLLQQLERPLQLLTGGSRDAPDRHRTLRATIAWSYDLLSPEEQTLFRQLGIFAGGFTWDALSAISDLPSGDRVMGSRGHGVDGGTTVTHNPSPYNPMTLSPTSTLDLLAALVDQSLVRQSTDASGQSRYALLRTIREFAREQMTFHDEEEDVAGRHATYFLSFAENTAPEVTGPNQRLWLDRLALEQDNLRQALQTLRQHFDTERELRLAAALWRFWWYRGALSEGRHALERALADGEGSTRVRAAALDGAGALAEAQGDLATAAIHHHEALELRRQLGDAEGQARALIDLGMIAQRLGHGDQATSLFTEALQIARDADLRPQIASSLANLGFAALDAGDLRLAVTMFRESLDLFRRLEDQRSLSYVLGGLGNAVFLAGDYSGAETIQEEALAVLRQLGDQQGIADTLADLAHAVQRQGDPHRAGALYQDALALYHDLGDPAGAAFVLTHSGRMQREQGHPARAAPLLFEAAQIAAQIGSQPLLTEAIEGLAEVASDRGEWANAARLLGMAEALRAETGMPLPAVHQSALASCADAARAALGDAGFDAARATGFALAPDIIVQEMRAVASGE